MPIISVIVPVYNVEKYLYRCIDSILNQSFGKFELILVDDGSTDSSGKICDLYAKEDNRIIVIHQKNAGQACARNKGVELAKSDWICFVDGDDCIHRDFLSILWREKEESAAGIVMCNAIESECVQSIFNDSIEARFDTAFIDEKSLLNLYNQKFYCWVVWGKLIEKRILIQHPFSKGKIYEDNAIVCKWIIEAHTVSYTTEQLYFYYINPVGTTKQKFSSKQFDYLWALREQIALFREKHYNSLLRKTLSNYIRRAAALIEQGRVTAGCQKRTVKEIFWVDYVLVKYRKFLDIEKKELSYLFDRIHPRIMRFYWYLGK